MYDVFSDVFSATMSTIGISCRVSLLLRLTPRRGLGDGLGFGTAMVFRRVLLAVGERRVGFGWTAGAGSDRRVGRRLISR